MFSNKIHGTSTKDAVHLNEHRSSLSTVVEHVKVGVVAWIEAG